MDLVTQGLLKSESDSDILSVNNKLSLGFTARDFDVLIRSPKFELPDAFKRWIFEGNN